MKKTKRVLLALLTFMSISCLAGCHKAKEEPVEPTDDPTPVEPTPEEDIYDLSFRNASGENGLIASATPGASAAGLEILKKGGNAFDAAAAVGFALGVTEPNATGLGGSGLFLAYVAKTGELKQFNFNCMCGKTQHPDIYDPERYSEQKKKGPMSIAVPGTVMGLTTLVKDFGSGNVTLADTIEPSVKLCEEGFPLTPTLSNAIYWDYFISGNMEQAMSIYGHYDQNRQKYTRAKRVGEIITNPNQAKVLKEIQAKGAEGFYKGWVAKAMLDVVKDCGTLTQEDFDYFLEKGAYYSTPLHTTYTATKDGTKYDVYSTSNPTSGGTVLIETLNELETYCKMNKINLSELGTDNPDYIHLVASAMQYAYSDRRAYVADTGINPLTNEPFNVLPTKGVINKEYAYTRFTKVFDKDKVCLLTNKKDYGEMIGVDPWDYNGDVKKVKYDTDAPNQGDSGTTSFSVVDKEGNMCCLTYTNASFWGSYEMPEGCGFMLNNALTNFNYGVSINQFLPYKHSAGYISPSMAFVNGAPYACFGSPGSEKIPCVEAQVFLNMVEHGMTVDEAIKHGRIYNYRVETTDTEEMEDPTTETYQTKKLIYVETYDYSPETLNSIRSKGYSIHAYTSPGISACQALRINYDANGKKINYEGAGDARRGGKALAY